MSKNTSKPTNRKANANPGKRNTQVKEYKIKEATKATKQLTKAVKKDVKVEKQLLREMRLGDRYAKGLGILDRALTEDMNKLLHSFFDINHEYHRTTSQGYIETAISSPVQTFIVTIPSGKYWNMEWCPSANTTGINTSFDLATGSYAYLVSQTADIFQSPFSISNNAVGMFLRSPFWNIMTIPGSSFRQIGAHMVITPISAPVAQAGSGIVWYCPEGFLGVPGAATYSAPKQEQDWNQLKLQTRFNGTEKMVINAPPNDDEFDMEGVNIARQTYSSIGVNVYNPNTSAISYQVQIRQSFEYEPTSAIRPLVEVGSPSMSDNVWPYFTKFIMDYYDKYVMCTYPVYEQAFQNITRAYIASSRKNAPGAKRPDVQIGNVPQNFVDYGRVQF
jgi:hypothetical protein